MNWYAIFADGTRRDCGTDDYADAVLDVESWLQDAENPSERYEMVFPTADDPNPKASWEQ